MLQYPHVGLGTRPMSRLDCAVRADRAPLAHSLWTDSKAELTLLKEPSADDLVGLFERISGRPATAAEKKLSRCGERADARGRWTKPNMLVSRLGARTSKNHRGRDFL